MVINDNFIPGTPWAATVTPARSSTFYNSAYRGQRVAALRMSNTSGIDPHYGWVLQIESV